MKKTEWLLCPLCKSKTRDRIREDTVLKNYPLYCPKCKQETLVEVKDLQTKVTVYVCSILSPLSNTIILIALCLRVQEAGPDYT